MMSDDQLSTDRLQQISFQPSLRASQSPPRLRHLPTRAPPLMSPPRLFKSPVSPVATLLCLPSLFPRFFLPSPSAFHSFFHSLARKQASSLTRSSLSLFLAAFTCSTPPPCLSPSVVEHPSAPTQPRPPALPWSLATVCFAATCFC